MRVRACEHVRVRLRVRARLLAFLRVLVPVAARGEQGAACASAGSGAPSQAGGVMRSALVWPATAMVSRVAWLIVHVPVLAVAAPVGPHNVAFPKGVAALVKGMGDSVRGLGSVGEADAAGAAVAAGASALRHALVDDYIRADLAEVRRTRVRGALSCCFCEPGCACKSAPAIASVGIFRWLPARHAWVPCWLEHRP